MAATAAGIAIGYARVSTERQASEGVSLEAQRAKIEAWCALNDRRLEGMFVDAGLSGGRADNRPELQKALDAACARPVVKNGGRGRGRAEPAGRVLVFYSLSRLARSTRDAILIADRLDKAGANLASVTEQLDTASATGRMIFRVFAAMAELERELISERTSAALQFMRSRNQRVGGVPYGFELTEDGETLRELASEQAVIQRMVNWRRDGLTLRGIAERLNEHRVPAKQSRRWHPSPIMDILRRAAAADAGDAGRPEGPEPAPQSKNG